MSGENGAHMKHVKTPFEEKISCCHKYSTNINVRGNRRKRNHVNSFIRSQAIQSKGKRKDYLALSWIAQGTL